MLALLYHGQEGDISLQFKEQWQKEYIFTVQRTRTKENVITVQRTETKETEMGKVMGPRYTVEKQQYSLMAVAFFNETMFPATLHELYGNNFFF